MIRRPQKRFGGALQEEFSLIWDAIESAQVLPSPNVSRNVTSRGTTIEFEGESEPADPPAAIAPPVGSSQARLPTSVSFVDWRDIYFSATITTLNVQTAKLQTTVYGVAMEVFFCRRLRNMSEGARSLKHTYAAGQVITCRRLANGEAEDARDPYDPL